MDSAALTTHVAEELEQVNRHWEMRRRHPKAPPGLTVALAREAGTPDRAVARALARRLHWPVYDRELLEVIAQQMGLRASLLESVDEKRVNWLLQSMEGLMAVPEVNDLAYLRHLIKTVLALGLHGACIIVGRGAVHILPRANTLRVRLVAPREQRIDWFAHEANLGHDEAARQVQALDRARLDFVRQYFFTDAADPDNYDLVLNVSRFSPDGCAQVIAEALHQRPAPEPVEIPLELVNS